MKTAQEPNNHLAYIPEVDKDIQIQKLTDRLMMSTVNLQAACYFIGPADNDFKEKFLKEIEESKKLLGI